MRILGSIPHPLMKISILFMNGRYVLKLEMGGMEQTFKVREGGLINSPEDILKLADEEFLEECLAQFDAMGNRLRGALDRMGS